MTGILVTLCTHFIKLHHISCWKSSVHSKQFDWMTRGSNCLALYLHLPHSVIITYLDVYLMTQTANSRLQALYLILFFPLKVRSGPVHSRDFVLFGKCWLNWCIRYIILLCSDFYAKKIYQSRLNLHFS